MTTAGTEKPIDIAGQFLADVQVFLGYEYAEPGRILFPQFAPYFSRFRDLPLAEHLEQAYLAIPDPKQKLLIREMVTDALTRCANTPLGINRSLVVVDLVHAIAPECWTDELWLELLWRPIDPKSLARWIGALALRWAQWNVSVHLAEPDILRAIDTVEPARFINLIEYLIASCASLLGDRGELKNAILAAAQRRIKRDAGLFAIEEVDCAAIEDFLHSCDTARAESTAADVGPSESSEERALREEMRAKWNLDSEEESPWPANFTVMEDLGLASP